MSKTAQPAQLALELIVPAEDNIRRDIGDVSELAASIASVGLVEPIVVTPKGDSYEIVAGARRYAGAKAAGLTEVPVRVLGELTEEQRIEVMLIENLQRVDLAPLEEAEGYRRLVDVCRWSQRKIAERIGRSQPHISKRLQLLELPDNARAMVDAGSITIPDALELRKLTNYPERLHRAIVRGREWGGISHQVEQELREQKGEDEWAAAVAEAESDPAPYKPSTNSSTNPNNPRIDVLPKGSVRLSKDYGALPITPAKHRKQPCHAVTVVRSWDGAKLTYICTAPKNHPAELQAAHGLSVNGAGPRSVEDQERKTREKALAAAAKDRRAFLADDLLTRKPARAAVLPTIVEALIDASHQSVLKVACQLLGVEPTRTPSKWAPERLELNYKAPLLGLAGATEARQLTVLLAIHLAANEERAAASWGTWGDLQGYFDYLQAEGWALTEAERTKLEQGKKEDAELEAIGDETVDPDADLVGADA